MTTLTPRISYKRDPAAARAQHPNYTPMKVYFMLNLGTDKSIGTHHHDEFLFSSAELQTNNFPRWTSEDLAVLFGDEINRALRHNPHLKRLATVRETLIEFTNRRRGTHLTDATADPLRISSIYRD